METFITENINGIEAVKSGLVSINSDEQAETRSRLPAIQRVADLVADKSICLPPQIIKGVLHQGLKAVIASTSKAGKTWMLLDMALSVSTGKDFWRWKTVKGPVLVVNFELPSAFFKQRIEALCKHKGVKCDNVDVWSLRGYSRPFEKLIPEMIAKIKDRNYSMIIIDPVYKGLAGREENKTGDIATLCNAFEHLAVETKAAVVYAHHFGKGNQAAKETIDRLVGSGVFARDADTIITLTPHDESACYTVDLTLRNLPEVDPFVVQWQFPVMVENEDLDPAKIKGKGGRVAESDSQAVLDVLADQCLSFSDWLKQAQEVLDISKTTFNRHRQTLEGKGLIGQSDKKWHKKPKPVADETKQGQKPIPPCS